MSFCKNGKIKFVDRGCFYICEKTNAHCPHSYWCPIENKYKPIKNFKQCVHLIEPTIVTSEDVSKVAKRKKTTKK